MELIIPNWKAPLNIKAYSTTRNGGVSRGVYNGLNLGMHVEDDPLLVEKNRQLLHEFAHLPSSQTWLNQTHSNVVQELHAPTKEVLDADGVVTSAVGVVCTVMTADCLPVLLTDIEGSKVAAVHAGWRGLANGILENAVNMFDKPVIAWLGPAIGANAFEVGQDVYDIFCSTSQEAAKAFQPKNVDMLDDRKTTNKMPHTAQKYYADMNLLADQRLRKAGVDLIYTSGLCTFENQDTFYSYRRDGITGRQASFIWIE